MGTVMELANSPMMWTLALIIVSLVVIQSLIYYVLARRYVRDTGVVTEKEIRKAVKIGSVSTIGPAVAVFTVAVVLIGLIGGPITLSRVGIIGSAAFESLTASAGSGGTLGTEEFTHSLLATAAWVMALGGSGWLITTLILTKGLDTTQTKLKQSNPRTIAYVGAFAPFMVFFVYALQDSMKAIQAAEPSYGVAAAVIAGAVSMYGFGKLARMKPSFGWVKEWAMGFAIIIAMIVGSLAA